MVANGPALRYGEAICEAELAGRLDVTQGATSRLEHSEDVRVSALGHYVVHASNWSQCSMTFGRVLFVSARTAI